MRKIYFVIMLLFLSCSSKQQNMMEYVNELSNEIISCTTQAEYDKVYEKIITLQNDERLKLVTDENEKEEIVQGIIQLTTNALAVNAVLYVLPQEVNISSADMEHLVNECIINNINIISQPYSDVREIVYEYYKISDNR